MVARVQVNCNKGELSPGVQFRPDSQAAAIGLSKCRNAFVLAEGGVTRRGGTVFIGECHPEAVLVDFKFSREQTYILEFSPLKMRIIKNDGFVVYPLGHPQEGQIVEIVTPFTSVELPNIFYAQSLDVITIVTGTKAPVDIKRLDNHVWEVSEYQADPPAWEEANINVALAITVTGSPEVGSSVTLTSTLPLFNSDNIGQFLRLEEIPDRISLVKQWEASKKLCGPGESPQNILNRSDGKVYRCATFAVMPTEPNSNCFSGTFAPIHEEGIQADGNGEAIEGTAHLAGVDWEYLHSGFGIVKITSFVSDTEVQAEVVSYIPSTVIGSPTYIWSFEAWNDKNGFPRTVGYFGKRRYFANTQSQQETAWGTNSDSFAGFKVSSPPLDTDSIEFTLAGLEQNAIQHILPMSNLILMTSTAEWVAGGGDKKVISPSSVDDISVQGHNGSAKIQPLIIGATALYVQYAKAEVRSLGFSLNPDGSDGYGGSDLSFFSRHLFKGYEIENWTFAREPWSVVWATRNDGALLAFTYIQEQQVAGWSLCDTKGKFKFAKSILENNISQVYLKVEREVSGETVHYIEKMTQPEKEDFNKYYYLDSHLVYDGLDQPAVSQISGLDHLEGEEVCIFADNGVQNPKTVVSGQITLDSPAKHVVVGLPYESLVETLPLELYTAGNPITVKMDNKKIHEAHVGVIDSRGLEFGQSLDKLQGLVNNTNIFTAPKNKNGVVSSLVKGKWDKNGSLFIVQKNPLPMHITNIAYDVNLSD